MLKHPFKVILRILLLSPLLFSCIKEGVEDCGVYLELIYDMNMRYQDSFVSDIEGVDVFVFDNKGGYLFHKEVGRKQLIGGNKIEFGWDLEYGSYQVLTVGGLSDSFRIEEDEGLLHPGTTTIEQIRIMLDRQSDVVSHAFSSLWVGKVVTVDYRAAITTYPVHFVKDTNHFLVELKAAESGHIGGAYTFEIVTPEGAVYSHENKPLRQEKLTYKPYRLNTGADGIITGEINTCRLFDTGQYRLVVRNAVTQQVEWEYNLMDFLAYSKPEARIDNTPLPFQEYLDRESEWKITLSYKEGVNQDFTAVAININGWIMWLHDIE